MQIQTTIMFHDESEFKKFCALMAGSEVKAVVSTKSHSAEEPVKPKAPVEKNKKVAAPEPEEDDDTTDSDDDADTDTTGSSDEESDNDENELTYAKVKEAVLKVSEVKGKVAAKRALASVGEEKVGPHIDEKKYSKLLAACNKELS